MTRDEELADLKRKLKASEGRPGLEERVLAIKAEIEKLEAKDAD